MKTLYARPFVGKTSIGTPQIGEEAHPKITSAKFFITSKSTAEISEYFAGYANTYVCASIYINTNISLLVTSKGQLRFDQIVEIIIFVCSFVIYSAYICTYIQTHMYVCT